MSIDSAPLEEFFVCASLSDSVVRHHKDFICAADGGKTMGDGDGGAVFGQDIQALLDPAFAFIIQGAGGFVQDQNGRVLDRKSVV